MPGSLRARVETEGIHPDVVEAVTRDIHHDTLAGSADLDGENFTRIHTRDLERLFDQYDQRFFDGQVRPALAGSPLYFRLSSRLTRAAGKTTRFRRGASPGAVSYEISVSTTLLFQCFGGDDHRPISVTGRPCADRLAALQRVMEHELVHLVELLVWTRSSCRARRFQSIAERFFAHRAHTHDLITPAEQAHARFGVRPGARVRFRLEGAEHEGVVNRVTRRATVLVPDSSGRPFSDGRRYLTFYVPVDLLEVIDRKDPAGSP